mgnify:CR=1 FL=1
MIQLELDPWLEGYLAYLRDVRRLNDRTIIDCRCTFKKVSAFMSEARPDKPLYKLDLNDYLYWLNAQRDQGRSEATIAKDLSHLRGLLDYAWRSGRSDRNVLDGFSIKDNVARKEPRSLTLEEAKRLVEACPHSTPLERRSRIVVLLLYGCGLRPFELCNLNVNDVDVERQEIFVRKGKGGLQRSIPVPSAVWTELLAYLVERGGKRGPLFKTLIKKKRLSVRDVGGIVKEAAARASIEGKITARTLRHTFGTHLMDAGVDLAVIASLMGHRSPAETGVYLHVLPGKREAAVDALANKKEDKR